MNTVAVVPIFMGAGAALLPTIMAAIAGVLALLFRPLELLRLCRRRPIAALSTMVSLALIVAAIWLITTHRRPTLHTVRTGPAPIDWPQVAIAILSQQDAGRLPTPIAPPPPPSHLPTGGPTQPPIGPMPVDLPPPASRPTTRTDFSRTLTDTLSGPTHLKPLWSFRPAETMFLALPAIRGPRAFVAGCQADLGGYTGILACLDLDTGKPLWQITALQGDPLKPFYSSPALSEDGQFLIIGQGLHEDRDCALLCFNAATGALRWSVKTPLHIESSPAILGDMAVVGAGAIEGKDGRAVGDPGYVFAVRISDGQQLWKQPVNDPESSPAIDDQGMVYIGSGLNGNALVAIRSQSDEELRRQNLPRLAWRTPLNSPVTGDVTLAGDLVIVGAGNGDFVHSSDNPRGEVIAVERATGHIRWQTSCGDSVLGSIASRGNLLACPCRTGEVLALARDTGIILWRTHISGRAAVLAGCALTDSAVYAVSSDGYLAILDATKGGVLEKIALNDAGRPGTGLSGCGPQIRGNHVIVGSETGGVRCLAGITSAAAPDSPASRPVGGTP